jgi:uncharacterized membrane protein YcaP (DUF421 family)
MNVNWSEVLLPSMPLLEIIVRGSCSYLALFVILRVLLKRQAGTVGVTDLLVLVLIADAIQNAMSGDYHSVGDGVLLVCVIVFWSYTLDWLSFRFPALSRLMQPSSLLLVKHGRMMRDNMARELISKEELIRELRKHGVEDVRQVKRAYMEGDGNISVITYEGKVEQPEASKPF